MTRVVQARCPYCQNMLRIPADWVMQAMKCKHCQQTFQAKPRSDELPPSIPSSAGAAHSVSMAPPFSRPKKGGMWQGAFLLGLALAVGGGVVMLAGPQLSSLFGVKENAKSDQKKLVEAKKGASDPATQVKPPPTAEQKGPPPPTIEPKIEPRIEPKSVDPPKKLDPPKSLDPPKTIDPPKKSNPPENTNPPMKNDPDPIKEKGPTKVIGDIFPRRALLINVSNYLLFNPLHYGNSRETPPGKYPGSSTGVLVDTMNRRPLNMPASQITELSDVGRNAFSTAKTVIENTVADFVDTSREQDRLILLFTGHGIEIDKEAYLVPVDGNREDVKTLIPLSWVYDKLAKCRARQKLLVLDVFRYPPARGEELPGTGEMTEDFDAKLLNPPAGVQVWASCIKGQQSIELEGGSVFLQALCKVLQDGLPGIASPAEPFPLDAMVPRVNQRLKEVLAPQKLDQVSRLSGTHAEEGGAVYNAGEPLPPKLVLKAVAPAGGQVASMATINSILDEINHLPPVRASQKQVQPASLPAFSAKVLEDYPADYTTWSELVDMAKNKEKYPLRAAVLEAIQVLKDSEKITMKESLTNPGGPITPQIKSQFAATQQEPGILIFHMEKALAELKAAGEMRDKETSKRWRAHYDYALARLQSRLVYVYEYKNILAQVRSDSLPPLEPIHNGWRVGSQKKVQISEPKVKEMVKNINKTWKRIAEENPGTPWAILAARESMTALGLVWRASRD